MTQYDIAIGRIIERSVAEFKRLRHWDRFRLTKWSRGLQISRLAAFRRCSSWLGSFLIAHPVGIIAGTLVLLLLYEVLFPQSIVILPISVPNRLDESGYTPNVAATHLRDALNKRVGDANTRMKSLDLALQADLPDFVVPTVGLTLETIATYIRMFLGVERRQNISGEFIYADNKLSLRLRKTGIIIYNNNDYVDFDKPDALLERAAIEVIEVTIPHVNAVILSHDEPASALAGARRIIAERPETDQNVIWAHNLLGNILFNQERFDDAIKEFRTAIRLNDGFATAHYNLGLALLEKNETKEAISHFHVAIRHEPDLAPAHRSLALALRELGNRDEAKCERERAVIALQRAINANPLIAANHRYLGELLNDEPGSSGNQCGFLRAVSAGVQTGAAIGEFQEAIKRDPHDASAYIGLGSALVAQRKGKQLSTAIQLAKSDEAIEAFRRAVVESGGRSSDARISLAVELSFRGRIDASNRELWHAIREYERLIRLDPNDIASLRGLGRTFLMLGEISSAMSAYKAIEPLSNYFRAAASRGSAEFAAAKYGDSANHLKRSVELLARAFELNPHDPYPVLWLYLARRHKDRLIFFSELQIIKMDLEGNEEANQWPLPIVRLFMRLDREPEKIFLATKEDSDRMCEANFYIGEWYLLEGDSTKAKERLQQAVKICPRDFIEMFGAQAALNYLPK